MALVIIGFIILVGAFVAKTSIRRAGGHAPALIFTATKFVGFVVMALGIFNGAFFYAEPGFKYHVRTIMGEEKMVNQVGYNTHLFGRYNAWKNAMTVQSSHLGGAEVNAEIESTTTSADLPPENLVFLDQVDAKVTATVRYLLPASEEEFLRMARQYRSPENLLRTELIPAFRETLGANAALMGAEEYFSGGKTQFNNEFQNQMQSGVYEVRRRQIERSRVGTQTGTANVSKGTEQEPFGDNTEIVFEVQKILDANGQPIRKQQAFTSFGITVVSARVTDVEPNEAFRKRMSLKQEAAANRAIAQERRAQEVQERLYAIEKGEREVAERQAKAKVNQIEKTTNAETEKQLAITAANLRKEQADIDRLTSEIRLEQAKIDAEAVKVAADAEAYQKSEILKADNALQQKLDAYVEAQKAWARAFSLRRVPSTVFAGGGTNNNGSSDFDVQQFLQIMTVQAAKQLNLDPSIKKTGQ